MEKIYYLPTHEYVKIDGEFGYVGISEYAAKQLGAVTYVDMPEEGDELTANEEFGAVESRKAASDLYSPVSGEVVENQRRTRRHPKLINNNPARSMDCKSQNQRLCRSRQSYGPSSIRRNSAKKNH